MSLMPPRRTHAGHSPFRRVAARGIALFDSLIAMLLLGLGLLGLAGAQMHMLAELRATTSRGQALQLIQDLSHRMTLNREAATSTVQAGSAAAAGSFAYRLDWGQQPTAAVNCRSANCSAAQLAQHDLADWAARVRQQLPGGSATVFQSPTDPRQVGIAIGWTTVEGKAADAGGQAQYLAPLALSAASHGVSCPAGLICHVVYVQP